MVSSLNIFINLFFHLLTLVFSLCGRGSFVITAESTATAAVVSPLIRKKICFTNPPTDAWLA